MKRNFILAGAVALALGSAGLASAAETAQECSDRAMQLQQVLEQSTMADSDKAELASTLSEAQTADLARCEQIVSRVEREVGVAPDASGMDPSMEQGSAADPSGTGDEYSTPGTNPTSSTTGSAAEGDTSYPAGNESAESTLRGNPGADDYETDNPAVSATGEPQGGYESPESTSADAGSAADGTMSDYGDAAGTTPGAADTGTAAAQDTAGEYDTGTTAESSTASGSPLASLTSEDLVNKPVHTAAGEEIGEIDKIVTDKSANEAFAVIGVGGVLGMGEKKVLLDVGQLQVSANGAIQVPAAGAAELEGYPEYDEDAYEDYDGEMASLL